MAQNVIVLTTGLSGSSVLTALIARAGYWLGDETIVKDNSAGHYDTFENSHLVELNIQLWQSMGLELSDESFHCERYFSKFCNESQNVDTSDYLSFIDSCNEHGPWVWKDPRLWISLGYWLPLLEKSQGKDIKFVVLTRNSLSLWISFLLKRKVVHYTTLKNSERKSKDRICQFLSSKGHDYVEVNYNELISEPKPAIEKLNKYLNSSLSLEDLKKVYKGKIPAKTWRIKDLVIASLIYIKNIKMAFEKRS